MREIRYEIKYVTTILGLSDNYPAITLKDQRSIRITPGNVFYLVKLAQAIWGNRPGAPKTGADAVTLLVEAQTPIDVVYRAEQWDENMMYVTDLVRNSKIEGILNDPD